MTFCLMIGLHFILISFKEPCCLQLPRMYASSSSSTSRKSRKRKRSPSRESRGKNVHNSNDRPSTSSSPLVDEGFSFEPYKKVLSKIITYSGDSNTIINHLEDFWVFLRKYEVTMKKAGKPLLEKKIIHKSQLITTGSAGIPISYSRSYCINFTSRLKFVDTFNDNQGKNFTKEMFDAFLEIVSIYLDFKNREKYEKLRKLRQVQKDLPVAKYRAEIVSAVKDNKVVIVAGDTGCGKSTQVPQYLHEAGYQSIACTQPRRIACISLSKRVSFEMLTQFQTQVGYQIRFEKSKNADTKICFITEGLLLRQMSSDSLPSYDVIILDEIHERHLMGDFLLGVLKCLVHTRNDLKLVLMSATINIKLFEDYFTGESAAVIQVPGRLYPIDLHYKPILIEGKPTRDDRLDPQPYVQIMQLIDSKYPSGIVVSIRELSCPNRYHYCALDLVIHSLVDERGDLLIFMSGVQEITAICNAAQQYGEKSKKWIVLPLHSALSIAEQDKVFDYPPEGVRKCIVSTNIAETSVTIDGIRFVADSGKVKEMNYDPTTKMQRLKEFWVSRASADQRKGRAGRTGPGVCYRVYSEKQYSEMDAFSTPEISRVPLASVFLLMTSLGMSDVRLFPFVDKPPDEVIENALQELKLHGALSSNEKLTPLGSALSKLPLEVSVGKALVVGAGTLSTHKLDSILALAAALGIRSLYTAAAHNDINCENARKPDESDHGDPLTLLSLYCSWLSIKAEGRGSSRSWCKRRGIEEQRLYEMTKLLAQLTNLLQDSNLKDAPEPENMSSAERSLRHGQMKQLKDMRRQYKQKSSEESKKKKRLKLDTWEIANDKEEDDGTIDIRDVEFRMTNDASRIRSIISGANASSGRDLMTLKMVLCRALYPQIALADEFNHCKSVSEQLFHTWSKPFVFLHPNSYFGKNPRVLQLSEGDIMIELPPGYKSKLPVSSKHQILCYLSLLETTKPYIVNSMRMPAAQTLLLLAHTVDTNLGFTRLVCDSWVLLEFPFPDSGINLVMKAVHLRKKWDALINRRLADANPQKSVETELEKGKSPKIPYEEAQYELSCEISAFMTTEVYYTVKRLLPGDLKVLYYGPDVVQGIVDPNPFEDGYVCHPHPKKGGVYVCDNLIYNCVSETDWSYNNYQELYNEPWACPDCDLTIPLSPIERLQHKHFTCASSKKEIKEESKSRVKEHKHNGKEFKCDICSKDLYLTPIEILKHKKNCKRK